MKKIYPHLPIIIVVLIATILRFKTTSALMTFTPDEAYQTYIAQTIIKNFHIIWIGLSAGSFGLFLGPLWEYFISPLLSFSKGDPLILGYLGSLIGVISTFILYYLGLKMYNKKVGIIASLLYATLPLVIFYDQKPYPTGVSFLSILIVLSIYMTKQSKYWWLIFAAAYGAVFNIHLSLLPLILVAIYWAVTHKKNINKKVIILSFLIFIAIVSPLIMFDYFHKWSNISAPFIALRSPHSPIIPTVEYHIKSLINSLGRIWYMPPFKNSTDEILWPCTFTPTSTFTISPIIFSLISIFALIYFFLKRSLNKKDEHKLLILTISAFIIPFTISSLSNPIEYYLVGLFPILFLAVASVTDSINIKIKPYIYFCILIISILGAVSTLSAKTDYGLDKKKTMIGKVMQAIGSQPYSLYEEGDCHKYEGWRYLFSVYARKPEQSSDDSEFGWLYTDELSKKIPTYVVLMKETRSVKEIPQKYELTIKEGGFTAYIYKNKDFAK